MNLPQTQPISKAMLEEIYGFSREKRRKLMNVVFFDDLKEAGYKVHDTDLSPKVVAKFIECFGLPKKNPFAEE